MAGKKKKKSGKLPKMTDEELVQYMEQQRLAEEEMRKKREDMLTEFLKVITIHWWNLSYNSLSCQVLFDWLID